MQNPRSQPIWDPNDPLRDSSPTFLYPFFVGKTLLVAGIISSAVHGPLLGLTIIGTRRAASGLGLLRGAAIMAMLIGGVRAVNVFQMSGLDPSAGWYLLGAVSLLVPGIGLAWATTRTRG